MGKTLCFTGHRPQKMYGYDPKKYIGLFNQVVECVKNLYAVGYTNFISGGAQGFDQLAFWAVDALKRDGGYTKISNRVYIPFEGQERSWPASGMYGQAEYHAMLQAADEVRVISDKSDKAALFLRNEAMVEDSDGILCLYEDDSWKTVKTGGTAKTMQFAIKHMMDIWQIKFNSQATAPYPIVTIQNNIFM